MQEMSKRYADESLRTQPEPTDEELCQPPTDAEVEAAYEDMQYGLLPPWYENSLSLVVLVVAFIIFLLLA